MFSDLSLPVKVNHMEKSKMQYLQLNTRNWPFPVRFSSATTA
ncbi:hypothetical protein SeW_A5112 [Salmonella enterica subsp. enterica serovar Weltevreden str. HI_N05-537]|nr:hypothetical protein SeW_A5112 [Salmonella enterica subsp. enterica serovar Weltevreden str. HI_N05-537]QUN03513.1 hypothetical protein [Salmonella enterica subsp. enterica serovar Weltevreden]